MSATVATQTMKDVSVPIEELPAVHAGLARAFGEAGMGGKQLDDIFSLAVTAKCVGCGISVTGTDLGKIAVSSNTTPSVEPKLDRLRLGYCARNGCDAKYYRVACEALPGMDTGKILDRGLELRHGPPPEIVPDSAEMGPQVPWFKRPKWLAVAALVVMVAVWAFRLASNNGLVPGLAPKPVYQSEPSKAREAL